MKKKMIKFSILVILILVSLGQASYAYIEIVPSKNGKGTDSMVLTSVTNSYVLCQNMKETGESLEGSSVLPHLSTNADWGAVSYLSNSIYGTNTQGQNTGVQISIDGVKYYSTTGNATGVMNWGANPNTLRLSQTASLIQKYVEDNSTSTANDDVIELLNNKDTRYVEIINTGGMDFTIKNTLGMALMETRNIYSETWGFVAQYPDYPISVRQGLFGFCVGDYYSVYRSTSGAAFNNATFRPVIWNK